jgi:KDO2-lipid IV(A) lauroyltransferase
MKKKIKNTLIYVFARLVIGIIRLMSFTTSVRFGRWLGRKAYKIAKHERRIALRQLADVFYDKSEQEIEKIGLGVFEHFGAALTECLNVHKIRDLSAFVEIGPESRQILDSVLAEGRGVVYVSCHCGNWELMARALGQLGYPINTIGKKSYDDRFTRLMSKFREAGSVKTIWRGDPDIVEKMDAVIRRGEVLGLLIDQDTKVPGVFVPFLGKLAYTPTAAASIARKKSVPVVLGVNFRREQGGYEIVIKGVGLSDLEDYKQAIIEDTKTFNSMIEEHILAHPTEWVWMHRRFKTRPEETV